MRYFKDRMENVNQEYRKFLNDYFNGLRLKEPLFYLWDLGLRFDLQIGKIVNPTRIIVNGEGKEINQKPSVNNVDYFDELIKRATTIFTTTFDKSDNVLLVYNQFKYRRRKIKSSSFIFRQVVNFNKKGIVYTRDPENDRAAYGINSAILKCKTEEIDFAQILIAIANSDFQDRSPRLLKKGSSVTEVYLINLDKKMIFHMFGDRGIDLIAYDVENLRPIYSKCKNWLIADKKNNIDKLF